LKKEEDTVHGKAVKAVLFDMDGVLVDSLDAWCSTFNGALKHFGLKTIPRKEFIKDFGAPIEHDVKKYFKGKTVKEVERAYNLKFKQSIKQLRLFPESAAVLKKLERYRIKVGLITNSTRFIVSMILRHFRLKNYFHVIVTMDDVKRRKPAPDMVLKACKVLKVRPKDTILIGDTKNDMIAGRRAGCITIGYKIKGNYRMNKLGSITSFLNQNPNRT
jgi:pyrophosphatase PpaX